MPRLKILKEPNKILREISEDVKEITDDLKKLSKDMLETMYKANGIGLAAVQVGVLKRLIVADIEYKKKKTPYGKIFLNKKPFVMINPVLVEEDGVQYYREGCLSVPNNFKTVQRANKVKVKYRDLENKEQELEAEGKLAVVIQHEMDHMDGILFIDRTYDPEGKDDANSNNSSNV